MTLFGLFCCLFGTFLIAKASVRDFSIRTPVMIWGFIVIILGILCVLTSIDWS